jgi:hypothetical protein
VFYGCPHDEGLALILAHRFTNERVELRLARGKRAIPAVKNITFKHYSFVRAHIILTLGEYSWRFGRAQIRGCSAIQSDS